MNSKKIKWEDLTLSDNYLFQTYMEKEENCKKLLTEILGKPVRKIEYSGFEESYKAKFEAKGIRLDVYIEGDEKIYNVEMQTTDEALDKRSRYYHSVLDLKTLQPGDSYRDIRESYVIFICTFDPFDKNEVYYHIQNQCTNVRDVEYDDGMHTIYLNTKGSKGKVSNYLKTFLNAVDGVFDSSELSAKIKEEVDEIKYSDKWREEYMFQEVHDQDMMLKGKRITVLKMVRDGDITIDRAGEILKMDVKELQKLLKEDYDKE